MHEEAYHFFFICKNYSNARYKFMDILLRLNELTIIDTHLLLCGDTTLPTELNTRYCIFSSVRTSIQDSGIFSC